MAYTGSAMLRNVQDILDNMPVDEARKLMDGLSVLDSYHTNELLEIANQLTAVLLKRADGRLEHKQEKIMAKRTSEKIEKRLKNKKIAIIENIPEDIPLLLWMKHHDDTLNKLRSSVGSRLEQINTMVNRLVGLLCTNTPLLEDKVDRTYSEVVAKPDAVAWMKDIEQSTRNIITDFSGEIEFLYAQVQQALEAVGGPGETELDVKEVDED